jgi:hypothetical protein
MKFSPATRQIGTKKKPYIRETVKDFEIMLSNGDKVIVPAGTQTDFATVPRLLWSFVSPYGYDEVSFIVHDYLYDNRMYTRKFCDEQMLFLQLTCGASYLRAFVMFMAVRIFGKKYW